MKLVKSYKKYRQHQRKLPLLNLLPVELLLIVLIVGGSISAALTGNRRAAPTPHQTTPRTLTQVTTAKPNAAPPEQSSTKTTDCGQVETAQANKYYGIIATDWGIWSKSTYLTSPEINYEYNQSVEQVYNDGYVPSMKDAGCTPVASLLSTSLKSPATAPDFSIDTTTPTYGTTIPPLLLVILRCRLNTRTNITNNTQNMSRKNKTRCRACRLS